jgi:hypothetical protein
LIAADGDCNGNGATATAMIDQSITTGQRQQQLQWHWGRSNRSNGTRNGATAIDRSHYKNDRLCAVLMWGAGVGVLFRVFIGNVTECQNRGANKRVTYSDVLV